MIYLQTKKKKNVFIRKPQEQTTQFSKAIQISSSVQTCVIETKK